MSATVCQPLVVAKCADIDWNPIPQSPNIFVILAFSQARGRSEEKQQQQKGFPFITKTTPFWTTVQCVSEQQRCEKYKEGSKHEKIT